MATGLETRPDKLLKTSQAEYENSDWSGKDESGIVPVGDVVVVLPDKAAERSSGGIIITEDRKQRMDAAAESGIVVALGVGAFYWNADRTRKFEGTRPEIGQRVALVRYAGTEVFGKDGKLYRCVVDNNIVAIKK